MNSKDPSISPIGDTSAGGATRRAAAGAEYRAQAEKLAPFRVIARAVILARADKDITQEQLAKALGTTKSVISRIESGRKPISYETLAKLGKALDITFSVGSDTAAGKGSVVVPPPAIEPVVPRVAAPRGTSHHTPQVALHAKSR